MKKIRFTLSIIIPVLVIFVLFSIPAADKVNAMNGFDVLKSAEALIIKWFDVGSFENLNSSTPPPDSVDSIFTYVIDPASVSKQVGQTQQFTGWYDPDGPSGSLARQNKTASARWSSSNISIVTINSSGLSTCKAVGFATITSVFGGITATASLNCSNASTAEEIITVYGDRSVGDINKSSTGIIHGILYDSAKDYAKTIEMIGALKPKFWRFSGWGFNVYDFVVNRGQFPQNYGTKTVVMVQDLFNEQHGGHTPACLKPSGGQCASECAVCFATFNELKSAWSDFVDNAMKSDNRMKMADYYDILNEPDGSWTWQGLTANQLLDLFKEAHNAIRRYKPDAKIIGPTPVDYNANSIYVFLNYAVSNNLKINGVSWHELKETSDPIDVDSHVAEIKSSSAYQSLCQKQGFCPEIHINEYASYHHLVPGWETGWLYHFEKNKVDAISKSCWDVQVSSKKWSDCWAGFDGLLMDDNITPQPIYWVHRSHVEMSGKMLEADFSDPRTVALASKDDSTQTIKLLVGRYGHSSSLVGNVNINIMNYPYAGSEVYEKIYRIPNQGENPSALSAPILIFEGTKEVSENKTISIPISQFSDGDAYSISITTQQLSCVPNCTNKKCGDDGCGGSCGSCGIGNTCKSNQCVPFLQTSCDRCSSTYANQRVNFYTLDPTCSYMIPPTNPVIRKCDCSCPSDGLDTAWDASCIATCAPPPSSTITFSRSPQTSQFTPFKAGEPTTATFQFTSWDNFQGKNWTLKSKTIDTVNGTAVNDADFVAGWNDIAAQKLCDSSGHCSIDGVWKASQFQCNTNINNIRKREEWVVVNGIESNHNTFYFKCSDTAPSGCDSSDKPSGDPPTVWWSPRPTTAQEYINAICGSGDSNYQAWCAWLGSRPQCVPSSRYFSAPPVTPPPSSLKYKCNNGTLCVEDPTGTYTTSNCDNACSVDNQPPIGSLGSKTNPIKLNNPVYCLGQNRYSWQGASDYQCNYPTLPENSKVYFEVDPFGYTGKSYCWISMDIVSNDYQMHYAFSGVDRITGKEVIPERAGGSGHGCMDQVIYDSPLFELDNLKLLFSAENYGPGDANISFGWVSGLYFGEANCKSQGGSCKPNECKNYNDCYQDYNISYYAQCSCHNGYCCKGSCIAK